MTTTEAPARYQARGTTDDVTTCGICGREDLKSTVILAIITPDGTCDGVTYAGSECAAKLSGRPVKDIRAEAARADDQARKDRQQAAAQASADNNARFAAWAAAKWGITIRQPADLWDHQQVTGMTPFQARKAWKAAA